jgi:hypothetical protein
MIVIRSQNGLRLTETKSVEIVEGNGMSFKITPINESVCLGTYESEKRAKEVLGLIESHVRQLHVSKIVQANGTDYEDEKLLNGALRAVRSNAVFTMPFK